MEFVLTRAATRLLLPIGSTLACALLGAMLVRLRRRRTGWATIGVGFAWLWLCSLPSFSNLLRGSLEGIYRVTPVETMRPADAIVVLGGTLGPPVRPRSAANLEASADRLLHAARLYRADRAPTVVVTGGAAPSLGLDEPEADHMATLLEEWGVPDSAILKERVSRNTFENCREVATLLEERGLERVILVTSALHMRRALATCRSAGIRATPAPTDFEVVDSPGDLLDWIPDASALEGTTRAIRELIGFEIYRLRGWIGEGLPVAPDARIESEP